MTNKKSLTYLKTHEVNKSYIYLSQLFFYITKLIKTYKMLKGHPKGLYVFLFANMGERFGYYTMLAIFILFLQARFANKKT